MFGNINLDNLINVVTLLHTNNINEFNSLSINTINKVYNELIFVIKAIRKLSIEKGNINSQEWLNAEDELNKISVADPTKEEIK